MRRTLATSIPVWVAVVAGVIALVALGRPAVWLPSIPVIGALGLLLTFLVQVSLQSKDGLVRRMQVSVTGIVLILAIASLAMLFSGATA
jgi:4-hydroxybenzoate polyprenyltransferase